MLKDVMKKDDLVEDPYEIFGFGIVAYFSMMRYLMFTFAVICVLFVPVIITYSKGDAFDNYSNAWVFSSMSMGNLGQAASRCVH